MNYNELYELCDSIYDLLEVLHSKLVEDDYTRGEVGKLMSDIEDIKGYIEDEEHDDYEETMRDVKRWLDARCGV